LNKKAWTIQKLHWYGITKYNSGTTSVVSKVYNEKAFAQQIRLPHELQNDENDEQRGRDIKRSKVAHICERK